MCIFFEVIPLGRLDYKIVMLYLYRNNIEAPNCSISSDSNPIYKMIVDIFFINFVTIKRVAIFSIKNWNLAAKEIT